MDPGGVDPDDPDPDPTFKKKWIRNLIRLAKKKSDPYPDSTCEEKIGFGSVS